MKNADLKVVAIILSLALLFTLFTTGIVNLGIAGSLIIDSVSPDTTDAANNGGNTNTNNNNSYVPNSGNNAGNVGNVGDAGNAGNAGNAGDAGNAGNAGDAGNAGNAGNVDSNDPVIADPFAFYSKYANEIHEKGNAGYKKVSWQAVEGQLTLNKLQFLAGTLTDLIAGFMTTKEDASATDCAKGSDDAKGKMPRSNCDPKYIKSASAQKDGDNYIVTIVLTDFVNPSYDDPDGLQVMSREFLDFKDVLETVATDDTVKAVVKSLDGTITYKDYTITATMTADGKFTKIVHYGIGDIVADVEAIAGSLSASGALSFNAEYYDFVY